MKNKTFINIQPQEVTENGERKVRYKGSDGKMHGIAPDGGNTAQEPLILQCDYVISSSKILFTDGNNYTIPDIIEMLKSGKKVFLKYGSGVMTNASYDEQTETISFFGNFLTGQNAQQAQQRVIFWHDNTLTIKATTLF